jgi:hypothetical protein
MKYNDIFRSNNYKVYFLRRPKSGIELPAAAAAEICSPRINLKQKKNKSN